jgi:hypothetical protein
MILDRQLIFSEAQAVTTSAANSTNVLDLGAAATSALGVSFTKDLTDGNTFELVAYVDTAFTSAGSGTLKVDLVISDAANLGSPTVIASTGALAKTTLTAGYEFQLAVPKHSITKRYLGLIYTVAVADMTAGKVTAALVANKQRPV